MNARAVVAMSSPLVRVRDVGHAARVVLSEVFENPLDELVPVREELVDDRARDPGRGRHVGYAHVVDAIGRDDVRGHAQQLLLDAPRGSVWCGPRRWV